MSIYKAVRILGLTVIGGWVHVALWYFAVRNQCEGVGLGAVSCSAIGGGIGLVILAYVASAGVDMYLLHRTRWTRRAIMRIPLLQIGCSVLTYIAFMGVFNSSFGQENAGAAWWLWELATQIIVVPVALLVMSLLAAQKGKV